MAEVYEGEARRRRSAVYAVGRERGKTARELAESYAAQAYPLIALLAVANILRLLYLVPEFGLLVARFWEIIWMPPELITQLYPTLYYGSLAASSTLPLAHLAFQLVVRARKGVALWVPEGALAAVNYALLLSSHFSLSLFAMLSKDIGTISLWIFYTLLLAAGASPTASELLKKVYAPREEGGEGGT